MGRCRVSRKELKANQRLLLSFFSLAPIVVSSTALVLNVQVAGTAFVVYCHAGYFSLRFAWPFITASIPAAFLGGLFQVPDRAYALVLAGVLLFVAWRMIAQTPQRDNESYLKAPSLSIALATGAGIGALSGVVGIGGGVFLSPLIFMMGWGDVRSTAATATLFVTANSLAALVGRVASGALVIDGFAPLLASAFAGGIAGSLLGSAGFSSRTLRRILGVVVFIAAVNLIYSWT